MLKLLAYVLFVGVLRWMQLRDKRAALREPPLELPDGGFRMRVPRFSRYASVFHAVFLAGILGYYVWGMGLRITAVVLGLPIALTVVWTLYIGVDVTRDGILARRMFRPTRHLPWSEITRAEWKPVTVRWLITDRAGRVLKIGQPLTGRRQLAAELLARCPRKVIGWKEKQ